ncbi:Acetyl-CoA acetyltransferase (thiolase II-like) [Desulfatibacillum aliphaticivorans]|uniref:Acetyl-CoA acetyltransferase (Thiolase II-like) n=1 Tax=Desulfatibacillum aliphaticivorans TaxID=218208 RepID=B8FLZ7_DESAL|nr:thiolase family protein [Desulfatibacillum aliphaticivorans]ACL05730.1 Acetyl-CoA acetyltransferase (thiolase II-like) [Desulfatibacillum aliphaticivorans]
MNQDDVVIVSAVRTPFGKFDGLLKSTDSIELGALALREVVDRIGLDPKEVDEIYYGTCIPAEYAIYTNVPARQISLLAGFPESSISLTIDRACCSSMTALRMGLRAIKAGEADVIIASGAENMGNTPLIARAEKARWGARLGPIELEDVLFELGYGRKGFAPVAADAGEVALEYGVSRELQDEWALQSHARWFQAYEEGKYTVGEELMSVTVPQRRGDPIVMDKDESPRNNIDQAKMAKLRPVYGSPTVTAGNAPGLNSGASAMVIMRRSKAESLGLKPLAKIEACQSAAGSPKYMACVPAQAIQAMLEKTGRSMDDLDLIEINEAFAAVTLVSLKMLAQDNMDKFAKLQAKTNVNGGAIAIGHPVGASGARITMTLMYELMRRGGGVGAAAICGGLSQGEALMLSV